MTYIFRPVWKSQIFQILASLFSEGAVFFYFLFFSSFGNCAVLDEVTRYGFRDLSFPEEEQHGHSWMNFANGEKLGRDLLPCVWAIAVTALYGPIMLSAAFLNIPMGVWSAHRVLVALDFIQPHSLSLTWVLCFFRTENQTVENGIILSMCIRTSEYVSH